MKKTLTDAGIAKLKAAAPGKRYDLHDYTPGLLVRVTDRGSKSFMFRHSVRNPATGRRQTARRLLGQVGTMTIDEARGQAVAWHAQVKRGVDPAAHAKEQRRLAAQEQLDDTATTVAAVFVDYQARHLSKKRRGHVVAQIFQRELLPHWGDRPLREIRKTDVVRLVEAIVDRPRAANSGGKERSGAYAHNVYVAIRAFFNWCINRAVYGLDQSPCQSLKPLTLIGEKRIGERVLDDREIAAFWRATTQMKYPYGPLLQLLLLTGCRKSEIAGARWREFNFAAKTFEIPAARYKTSKSHTIPVTDDVLALVALLPRFRHGDLLFSTTFGAKRVNGWSKAKSRLDRLMREQLGDFPPFEIHALRRTFRTRLSRLRVPEAIAEAALGHSKKGIIAVYNKDDYADELRDAYLQWQSALHAIIDPPAANVLPFAQAEAS